MRVVLFFLLLVQAGCAIPKSLDAGITFYQMPKAATGERVEYRFSDGLRWRKVTARTKWADQPLYDYRIPPWGSIVVESRLVRDGRIVSKATLKISAGRDLRFDVHSEVRPDDPTSTCFGCGRPAASAPIMGHPGERLWLWYGFNGISHPLIF